MNTLDTYKAVSGTFEPVWRLDIQTRPDDADRLVDAVMAIDLLEYGRYQRNAAVSAVGAETLQPKENSTTTTHIEGFKAGNTDTHPMVQLTFSIQRDIVLLEKVMDAVIYAHHYEEPVIYLRDEWASRAVYDPNSDNPNRWWNDGRGMPKKVKFGFDVS